MLALITAYALRSHGERASAGHPKSQSRSDPLPDEEDRWIVCSHCRERLTRPGERVVINGSHSHTFANPSGVVFEIGCFGMVRGVNFIGPPSYEFPWFAGHSWQIVICSVCQAHLGWCFQNQEGRRFFGLILDRIQQVQNPQGS